MKSKRRSKGDSTWGNKTSPNSNSSYRSPLCSILGDFITCSPGSSQKIKLGQTGNGEVDSAGKAKLVNQSKQPRKNIELKTQGENDSIQLSNCNGLSEKEDRKSEQGDEIKNQIKKEESGCSGLPAKMDIPNNSMKSTVELGKVTCKEKIYLLGKLHATLIQGKNGSNGMG